MSRRPKAAPETAAALAQRAVAEWFETIVASRESHAAGNGADLDGAFEVVQTAVEREYVREHGPIKPDEDGVQQEIFAQEAGYLIGVQVGLRLRGGAR